MNKLLDKKFKILAIETSCDETSAAVIEVNKSYNKLIRVENSDKMQLVLTNINQSQPLATVISNIVSSQVKIHAKYGGVFPEMASREHLKNIIPVIQESLEISNFQFPISKRNPKSKIKILNSIDAIAVTSGPGLIGSLLVGVETAKTLSCLNNIPIYPVHHLEGHIYSNFVGEFPISNYQFSNKSKNLNLQPTTYNLPSFPLICLAVSGGHTSLVYMKNHLDYKVIGETLDDAAGEAFDKVAKLLDLGFPGGPVISRMADKVTKGYEKLQKVTKSYNFETISNQSQQLATSRNHIHFPRPMIDSNDFNFSFSGLKTSVLYQVKKLPKPLSKETKVVICNEFQNAVVETLVAKTIKAAKKYKVKSILLGGGVASNNELKEKLKVESEKLKVNLFYPNKELCTDNAAMIGIAAAYKIALGKRSTPWYNVNADSSLELQ